MTTAHCRSAPQPGGDCPRAVVVESSEFVHQVTYTSRNFLIFLSEFPPAS
jgi:hypothetical protein